MHRHNRFATKGEDFKILIAYEKKIFDIAQEGHKKGLGQKQKSENFILVLYSLLTQELVSTCAFEDVPGNVLWGHEPVPACGRVCAEAASQALLGAEAQRHFLMQNCRDGSRVIAIRALPCWVNPPSRWLGS